MSVFKNKHVIAALIIAPVLAILSYFVTDTVVSEKPRHVVPGHSYPLAARPDCRYQSGHCTLENGDLKFRLSVDNENTRDIFILKLSSSSPLNSVTVSVFDDKKPERPRMMTKTDEVGMIWQFLMDKFDADNSRLRIAALTDGSYFYAETGLIFTEYQTPFPHRQ